MMSHLWADDPTTNPHHAPAPPAPGAAAAAAGHPYYPSLTPWSSSSKSSKSSCSAAFTPRVLGEAEYCPHDTPAFYKAKFNLVWPPVIPSAVPLPEPTPPGTPVPLYQLPSWQVEFREQYVQLDFEILANHYMLGGKQRLQLLTVAGQELVAKEWCKSKDGRLEAVSRVPTSAAPGLINYMLSAPSGMPTLEALRGSAPLLVLPPAAVLEVQALFLRMMAQAGAPPPDGPPDAPPADPALFCAAAAATPAIFHTPLASLHPLHRAAAQWAWTEHFTPFANDIEYLLSCMPTSPPDAPAPPCPHSPATPPSPTPTPQLPPAGILGLIGPDGLLDDNVPPSDAPPSDDDELPPPPADGDAAAAPPALGAEDAEMLHPLGEEAPPAAPSEGITSEDEMYNQLVTSMVEFLRDNELWATMSFLLSACLQNGMSVTNNGTEVGTSELDAAAIESTVKSPGGPPSPLPHAHPQEPLHSTTLQPAGPQATSNKPPPRPQELSLHAFCTASPPSDNFFDSDTPCNGPLRPSPLEAPPPSFPATSYGLGANAGLQLLGSLPVARLALLMIWSTIWAGVVSASGSPHGMWALPSAVAVMGCCTGLLVRFPAGGVNVGVVAGVRGMAAAMALVLAVAGGGAAGGLHLLWLAMLHIVGAAAASKVNTATGLLLTGFEVLVLAAALLLPAGGSLPLLVVAPGLVAAGAAAACLFRLPA